MLEFFHTQIAQNRTKAMRNASTDPAYAMHCKKQPDGRLRMTHLALACAQVRADVAEALYMQLLAMDEADLPLGADLAAAQDLLASTAWDGPAPAAAAARDALYAPLGLPCPAQKPSPDTPGLPCPAKQADAGSGGKCVAGVVVTCVADEHASYAALLVDAGRGI